MGKLGDPPTPPTLPPTSRSHRPQPEQSVHLQSLKAVGENLLPNAINIPITPAKYRPIYYFLYGTLTKPKILKHILNIQEEPVLRPAKVTGYAISSWGQYLALINGDTGTEVAGYTYEVQTVEHEHNLAYYETNAYKLSPCKIYFTDGKEPVQVNGNTFKYGGDANALMAGRFDRFLWECQMGLRLPDQWRTPPARSGAI